MSDVALAPSPAIDPPTILKPLSGPNIISPPTPAEQTVSIHSPSSSPLMTSRFSAQGIPAPFSLFSGAVVKPLVPSLVIGPPAILKTLSGLNIIPLPTPAKETVSIISSLSSPLMTFPFSVQGIPALSTFLSGAVVKPSMTPAP